MSANKNAPKTEHFRIAPSKCINRAPFSGRKNVSSGLGGTSGGLTSSVSSLTTGENADQSSRMDPKRGIFHMYR